MAYQDQQFFDDALKRKYNILQQNANTSALEVAQKPEMQASDNQARLNAEQLRGNFGLHERMLANQGTLTTEQVRGGYGLQERMLANQGTQDVANTNGRYGLQIAQQPEFGMHTDPDTGSSSYYGKNLPGRLYEDDQKRSPVLGMQPTYTSLGAQGLGLGLPGFRAGGFVQGGQPIQVGEAGRELYVPSGGGSPAVVGRSGPEALIPHSDGQIVPNAQTEGFGLPVPRPRTGPLTSEELDNDALSSGQSQRAGGLNYRATTLGHPQGALERERRFDLVSRLGAVDPATGRRYGDTDLPAYDIAAMRKIDPDPGAPLYIDNPDGFGGRDRRPLTGDAKYMYMRDQALQNMRAAKASYNVDPPAIDQNYASIMHRDAMMGNEGPAPGVIEGRGDGPITMNGRVIDPGRGVRGDTHAGATGDSGQAMGLFGMSGSASGRSASPGRQAAGSPQAGQPSNFDPAAFLADYKSLRTDEERAGALASRSPRELAALRQFSTAQRQAKRSNAPAQETGGLPRPAPRQDSQQAGGLAVPSASDKMAGFNYADGLGGELPDSGSTFYWPSDALREAQRRKKERSW